MLTEAMDMHEFYTMATAGGAALSFGVGVIAFLEGKSTLAAVLMCCFAYFFWTSYQSIGQLEREGVAN